MTIKKEIAEKYKNELINNVHFYTDQFWKPNDIKVNDSICTNSWYYHLFYFNKDNINDFELINDSEKCYYTKCRLEILLLNKFQKNVILKWMDAYLKMYNEVIKYFKDCEFNKTKPIVNYKKLRDNNFKDTIKDIFKNSQLKDNKKDTKIKMHMLVGAIKLVCSNYKSAQTNIRRGFQKGFTMHYMKRNKTRIIDIEPQYISKKYNTICQSILGNEIKSVNNIDLRQIKQNKKECKIFYDILNKKFLLIIPIKEESEKIENETKQNFISIDAGLRTFITGYTEKGIIEIGNNVSETISKYLKKLDKILNNENISDKIKKKNRIIIEKKIKGLITELHWKIINYLTKNYDNIIIGIWKTKSVISNKNENGLKYKMAKRIIQYMSFHKFLTRLEYKCKAREVGFKKVHEGYTTKICSICGNYNNKIKGEKIYDCKKCHNILGRDVNSGRCLLFKSLPIEEINDEN